jgi:hypothetical protein
MKHQVLGNGSFSRTRRSSDNDDLIFHGHVQRKERKAKAGRVAIISLVVGCD